MDWRSFFDDNVTAIVGLLGVMLGGILGLISATLLQVLQRRWTLDDQRREWRRNRLAKRLTPIQDWVDVTIRLLRAFERSSKESFADTDFWNGLEEDLQTHFRDHERHDALVFVQTAPVRDKKLTKYVNAFAEIRNAFMEALTEGDETQVHAHMGALEISGTLVGSRIDYLLESTFTPKRIRLPSWLRSRDRNLEKQPSDSGEEATAD